jgi:hypothetical protein
MTDPIEALESLDDLMNEVAGRVMRVHVAVGAAKSQWAGLGLAGGQRADHAASLLREVGAELGALSRFARDCGLQIQAMQDDPFERKVDK